jgi:negative regulator of sigma-B (phosphoserine phosphatase)
LHTVAYLTRPREHETESGDAVVVRDHGEILTFAVIDALGHGPVAAAVAERARTVLLTASPEADALTLLTALHEGLSQTRGAAALVCVVRGNSIEGCGVGNVEMRTLGSPVPVVLSPGILGSKVRKFRPFAHKLTAPTRVIVFTDGISPRFSSAELRTLSPQTACERLFAGHRRAHDDASVLVADLGALATA